MEDPRGQVIGKVDRDLCHSVSTCDDLRVPIRSIVELFAQLDPLRELRGSPFRAALGFRCLDRHRRDSWCRRYGSSRSIEPIACLVVCVGNPCLLHLLGDEPVDRDREAACGRHSQSAAIVERLQDCVGGAVLKGEDCLIDQIEGEGSAHRFAEIVGNEHGVAHL